LKHVRFLFLAAILLAPLLARTLDMIPPYRPEIDKPLLNAAVMVFALIFAIPRFPSGQDLEKDIAKRFPAGAVNFISSHGLSGNIFNRYEWGGYLIYYSRDVKTFIDGRTDIFDYTGVLKHYVDAESIRNPLEVLSMYQVRSVLSRPDRPLAYLLRNKADWKIVYSDDVAVIFERTVPLPNLPQPAGSAN
jgi:hypothetical protein